MPKNVIRETMATHLTVIEVADKQKGVPMSMTIAEKILARASVREKVVSRLCTETNPGLIFSDGVEPWLKIL
jgi:hypothetical protein